MVQSPFVPRPCRQNFGLLKTLTNPNIPADVENKSTPAGFRAGMNLFYEIESNIHFPLGGVTFHAKHGV